MGNEIRLKYLSEEGLANLKRDFEVNLSKYQQNDQNYFIEYLNKKNFLLDSAYIIPDFQNHLVFSSDKDSNDLTNIKVVYEAMKNIPTYIALDDRFWAGINHTYMWDYIMKRREEEAFANNLTNKNEKIYNSFFTHTKHGKKRGTYVNCVSRLWWAGYLTYDETNSQNHYELTAEICKTGFASTIILLSSSNILNRHEAMHALLKTIKKKRNEGYKVSRNDIVDGIRYLNLIAGMSLIDLLIEDEICELLEKYYNNYLKYSEKNIKTDKMEEYKTNLNIGTKVFAG